MQRRPDPNRLGRTLRFMRLMQRVTRQLKTVHRIVKEKHLRD